MGLVDIPANPTVPGKVSVRMDLAPDEVRLQQSHATPPQTGYATRPSQPAAIPPISQTPVVVHVTTSHQHQPRPPQPSASTPASAPPAPRTPAPAFHPPSAPPPPPPQPMSRPAAPIPPAAAPYKPSVPSAPRSQGKWSLVSSTQPLDHGRDPVIGLAFCSQLDGLPGGDGHGGWLISSSKRTLNLWECYRAMPSSHDQALELMHSQNSDFISHALAVEPSLGLMFTAGLDLTKPTPSGAKQWAEVVGVHSVTPSLGLLSLKYRCSLPPSSEVLGPQASTLKSSIVSLHQMGRNWRGCCLVSQGKKLLVYESHDNWAAKGDVKKPMVEWEASSTANVTSLVSSPANGLLASGSSDGVIKGWNARSSLGSSSIPLFTLRSPSNGPQDSRAISSIQVLSESLLISSSSGGPGMFLWDLRSTAAPLKTLMPDASPISLMKLNASGDLVAVVTGRGLYVASIGGGGNFSAFNSISDTKPASSAPPQKGKAVNLSKAQGFIPPINVEWNCLFDCLYTSGSGGIVKAFREGRYY